LKEIIEIHEIEGKGVVIDNKDDNPFAEEHP